MLPQLTASELTRFWSKVDTAGPCWLWRGTVDDKGYGRLGLTPRPGRPGYVYAHILGHALIHGPIPEGAWVCHDCPGGDNPLCVLHTFLGDADANNKDAAAKQRFPRGERWHAAHPNHHPVNPPHLRAADHPRTPFTWDDVHAIRAACAAGASMKQLAREHGVAYNSIWQIVHRRTWLD